MATLKEFEESLREHGMHMALALLERLRERDRATRTTRPARRITGKKMTPELARAVLELHATTGMTQQEIAFKVGVNQGRVNEVIKHGKWLDDDPTAPEQVARDKAVARMQGNPNPRPARSRKAAGAPKTGAPKTGAPKTGAPKTGASKTGAPKTGASKTGASKTAVASKTGEAKPGKPGRQGQLSFGDL